ncbi:MAG: carbamoyltransferase HypF, partial [Thermoplasmata archaeon]|nr:carbamoyltransferase HypF [Thermoplasmata archaeon]
IIPHREKYYFIRRSRGFVPVPIEVPYDNIVLAVGAELNVTSAISKSGKLYTSQYIGNTKYYKSLEFLNSASQYLMHLLGIRQIDAIALDLHPQYPTRKLAMELAEEFEVKTFEIQHHWSHAASLMLDAGITEPIIALTLDGAGYGSDGTIWGGEVLISSFTDFNRIGSLELLPLIGGDKAVYEPTRLVFGIYEKLGLNSDELEYFPVRTAEVFRKMINNSPVTSSLGRILDALSCYFGIAIQRTYDGEPAMKLERYLANGKPVFEFETVIKADDNNVHRVQTIPLFKQLFEYVGTRLPTELPVQYKADLSYSFVLELIRKLTKISLEESNKAGINYIGITGGVTYNIPIIEMIRDEVLQSLGTDYYNPKLEFITHSRLPNGDGGISPGQNVITGHLLREKIDD